MSSTTSHQNVLKTTRSRCPQCLDEIDATVVQIDQRVMMHKTCAIHGEFTVQLAADARFYHTSLGNTTPSCGCGSGNCAPTTNVQESQSRFDVLSSCIVLIEIVESCNLSCPTCYAASPFGIDNDLSYMPLAEFQQHVQNVIDRKGLIDIVQLSGGEPTLHPQFDELLDWCVHHDDIGYVLINTNGVRIAQDKQLRTNLSALHKACGKFELYLQFDGTQLDGQFELRAADLRAVRESAIDSCGALGIPTTLGMTVTPQTIAHLGDTLRFGLSRPHVRGITFQPMFMSGRLPDVESSTLPVLNRNATPISVGDVILNLVEQSDGVLNVRDFTPLPCGDPNCHTIGYLLRLPNETVGLSNIVDLESLQGFLRDRLDYNLQDLARCGCETEPLGNILKGIELSPELPFRLFIKPFMDAWTFDEHRIDRCCTHVLKADGTLDSFCRHYLNVNNQ